MELKEGMYIRNSNGKIEKIKFLVKQNNPMFKYTINCTPRFVTDIKKASFDLFDLIEVGDFLDNHCVEKIKDDTIYLNDGYFIAREDIEEFVSSVVTKEQFESCKYVIERDE